MMVSYLKAKLHRATVRDANLEYEGSITIGRDLIAAAGFDIHEKVDIYNITNGERFSTYVIPGETPGEICLNGAAAWKAKPNDKVIIVSYCLLTPEEAKTFHPTVVLLGEDNQIRSITRIKPA